jgi:hypothetical protein
VQESDNFGMDHGDADTFPGSPDDMSAFTTPPNHSARKSRPRPAMGRDKAKQKRKTDDIAEKAAGAVKDYIAETNKVNGQESAKKWATIEKAIVEMTKTSQQLVQMQLMERAPAAERDRYFDLMRQKAMIDAENELQKTIKLPMPQPSQEDDNSSRNSMSDDDSINSFNLKQT